MDLDVRHLTGFIVIVSGAGVLAMSYVAAFLIGKNAGRKEGTARETDATRGRRRANPSDSIESSRLSTRLRFRSSGSARGSGTC
jgi:hypothetical protein